MSESLMECSVAGVLSVLPLLVVVMAAALDVVEAVVGRTIVVVAADKVVAVKAAAVDCIVTVVAEAVATAAAVERDFVAVDGNVVAVAANIAIVGDVAAVVAVAVVVVVKETAVAGSNNIATYDYSEQAHTAHHFVLHTEKSMKQQGEQAAETRMQWQYSVAAHFALARHCQSLNQYEQLLLETDFVLDCFAELVHFEKTDWNNIDLKAFEHPFQPLGTFVEAPVDVDAFFVVNALETQI